MDCILLTSDGSGKFQIICSPDECIRRVSRLKPEKPSVVGAWMIESPCLLNTGMIASRTAARSAYLERKCGLVLFMTTFWHSAWAFASAAAKFFLPLSAEPGDKTIVSSAPDGIAGSVLDDVSISGKL